MVKTDFFGKIYYNRCEDDIRYLTDAEKGGYMDLFLYQLKHDRFSEEDARRILGKRFTRYWPSLKTVLQCVEGMYFVPWADDSVYETHERKARFSDMATEAWKRRKAISEAKKKYRI